jgi:hypothetical protein
MVRGVCHTVSVYFRFALLLLVFKSTAAGIGAGHPTTTSVIMKFLFFSDCKQCSCLLFALRAYTENRDKNDMNYHQTSSRPQCVDCRYAVSYLVFAFSQQICPPSFALCMQRRFLVSPLCSCSGRAVSSPSSFLPIEICYTPALAAEARGTDQYTPRSIDLSAVVLKTLYGPYYVN